MILDIDIAKKSIGKIITWHVDGYAGQYYEGKDVILDIVEGVRPLVTKTIEGDDLSFAYLEDYGYSLQGEYLRRDENAPHVFTYSDGDRYVQILSIEDNG